MKRVKDWLLSAMLICLAAVLSGCAAAAAGAVGAGMVAAVDVAEDERNVETVWRDSTIASAVKSRLTSDRNLGGLNVTVYSFRHRVYIVGYKTDESQEARAETLASSVKGVRSVESYLIYKKNQNIVGQYAGDAYITSKIKAALLNDPDIKSSQVTVETITGHAVLLGIVSSGKAKSKAYSIAKRINEGRPVKSFLTTW